MWVFFRETKSLITQGYTFVPKKPSAALKSYPKHSQWRDVRDRTNLIFGTETKARMDVVCGPNSPLAYRRDAERLVRPSQSRNEITHNIKIYIQIMIKYYVVLSEVK